MEEIEKIEFSTIKIEFDDNEYVLVWKVTTDKHTYWLRKQCEDTLFVKKCVYWNMHNNFSGEKGSEELMKKAISKIYENCFMELSESYLPRETLMDNLLTLSKSLICYDKDSK